jgi:hypothetical protein
VAAAVNTDWPYGLDPNEGHRHRLPIGTAKRRGSPTRPADPAAAIAPRESTSAATALCKIKSEIEKLGNWPLWCRGVVLLWGQFQRAEVKRLARSALGDNDLTDEGRQDRRGIGDVVRSGRIHLEITHLDAQLIGAGEHARQSKRTFAIADRGIMLLPLTCLVELLSRGDKCLDGWIVFAPGARTRLFGQELVQGFGRYVGLFQHRRQRPTAPAKRPQKRIGRRRA